MGIVEVSDFALFHSEISEKVNFSLLIYDLVTITSMSKFLIDSSIRISQVHLRVSNIDKSLQFYESFLGFKIVERNSHNVFLSPDGKMPYLVALSKAKSSDVNQQRSAGLYHFAILLPQRKDLGNFLANLLKHKNEVKIDGFSDHLVSEAIYIRDPDHIGIEIYRDRPHAEWVWDDNQVQMTLDPLNTQSLLAESDNPWTEIPAKTMIGHVHLHVSNLAKAKKFYAEILGFVNTASMHGALFFAAGNYHHHIATNVWLGENIPNASTDFSGLDYFTIKFSSKTKLDEVISRLGSNKITIKELKDESDSFEISDEDKISIHLVC